MLTAVNLLQLRNDLLELGQLHIDRSYLRQVARYLRWQGLRFELSPSALGVKVTLASSHLVG